MKGSMINMRRNKLAAWLLVVSMFLSLFSTNMGVSYAEASTVNTTDDLIKQQLDKNLAYILRTVSNPTLGTGKGEWSILSLARANYPVPSGYYDIYYNNVVKVVTDKEGVLDKAKYTEHSRLILGLTSIGKDVSDVGGYNQLVKLADYKSVISQGLNGPVYALIALDSNNYAIPQVAGINELTTREKLIQYILDKEVKKDTNDAGGWTLFGNVPDPDMTAMTVQSLAPYYNKQEAVTAAVDRAMSWLSQAQKGDGGFASSGTVNAESTAQVVVALTELGIDPQKDVRFVKNGKSSIDALLTFALPDGGFKHLATGGANGLATDQGTYALVSYDRFVNGKNRLYDMTDVFGGQPEQPEQPDVPDVPDVPEVPEVPDVPDVPEVPNVPHGIELSLPAGAQPKVDIPQDDQDYIIPITAGDSDKEISIAIPDGKNSKVSVNLPLNSSLPKIVTAKGIVSLVIPKAAQILSGDASALELISPTNLTGTGLNEIINAIVPNEKKLDAVVQAFSMGGHTRIEFSEFVTITFTGMSGKDAAYIESGLPYAIAKFASDLEGMNSGKSEYAFDSGNDLIVKTKHFTDYIAYTSSLIETPGNGEGTAPVPQPKQYVTLSVDKLTINKGYVVPATSVELQSGDTVWTVFQRVLNNNHISYDYKWYEDYGSVYVKSIAGDGELNHGEGSGWMYNVNSWYPNYGADNYILKNGDVIQWRYTTNYGIDLGVNPDNWEKPVPPNGSGIFNPNDSTPVIEVPKDIRTDYILNIAKEQRNTDNITINIPNVKSKIILNLKDVIDGVPRITATKGDISVVIEKGTQLKTDNASLELISTIDPNDAQILKLIKGNLSDSDKLSKINHAFMMGHSTNPTLFDKPLTLIIKGGKYQLLAFIEGDKLTSIRIYESEEAGIQATKDQEKQTYAFVKGNDLYIRTNHFTSFVSYTVSQADSVEAVDLKKLYADADTISSWSYKAISEATQNGFVQGSNGKFNPKSTITRAEFTKILVSVLDLDTRSDKAISFTDVAQKEWFYPYVNAAYKDGFITGFNDKFNPNDNITREQMAATLIRALAIKPTTPTTAIKDIHAASVWAKTDVETIVALELMLGNDNQFKPKDFVTREMAAVVAVRAYDYKKGNKDSGQEAVGKIENNEVKKYIQETAAFLQRAVADPSVASIGGEWTVLGLARSDVKVPDEYYAKYYANLEATLKEKSGKLHDVKYTEYDRVILALTSMGKNIDHVAGYHLSEPLADFDTLIKQGINGPIFALIALDSKPYEIPLVDGIKTQTTREMLMDYILGREIDGGGWALASTAVEPDPDMTAMVIQGLAPYYQADPMVKKAVDRGVDWLSKAQKANGGYASWDSINSESIAQVIIALTSLGIDPHKDSRFIKNGHSVVDALLSFAAPDGGFYHLKQGGVDNGGAKPGEVDLMASDQALCALVAYDRFVNGQNRLYDMTDVK